MDLAFSRFPRFPLEVQQDVFLTFKDDRRIHRYANVAHRMHVWLEPYVYRIVHLSDDDKVMTFLACVAKGSQALHVVKLVFGTEVSVPSMIEVLTLCRNVEVLAIQPNDRGHVVHHSINLLMETLNRLLRIKTMYTGLAMITEEEVVNFPDFSCFNRLSQLHLSGASWNSWCSVLEGLSDLPNLTHLSMFWSTSRSCTSQLLKFLAKSSTVVLIIWISSRTMEGVVQRDLRNRQLQDTRVVTFRAGLMSEYMADGGFWKSAECVIRWRADNQETGWEFPVELGRPSFFQEYKRMPGLYLS